jgi:hypothetical protein
MLLNGTVVVAGTDAYLQYNMSAVTTLDVYMAKYPKGLPSGQRDEVSGSRFKLVDANKSGTVC